MAVGPQVGEILGNCCERQDRMNFQLQTPVSDMLFWKQSVIITCVILFTCIYIVTHTRTQFLIFLSLIIPSLWNSVSFLLWFCWCRFSSHLCPKLAIWKKSLVTFWLWNSGTFFFPTLKEHNGILLTLMNYASDVAHRLQAFKSLQSC